MSPYLRWKGCSIGSCGLPPLNLLRGWIAPDGGTSFFMPCPSREISRLRTLQKVGIEPTSQMCACRYTTSTHGIEVLPLCLSGQSRAHCFYANPVKRAWPWLFGSIGRLLESWSLLVYWYERSSSYTRLEGVEPLAPPSVRLVTTRHSITGSVEFVKKSYQSSVHWLLANTPYGSRTHLTCVKHRRYALVHRKDIKPWRSLWPMASAWLMQKWQSRTLCVY